MAKKKKTRRYRPGVPTTYKTTRRTHDGTHFFAPEAGVRELCGYVLGYVANKYGIKIHAGVVMSNHPHLVATDSDGVFGEFLSTFHSLLARAINRRHDREDHVWDARETCVQEILRPEDQVGEFCYVAANPVACGKVATASDWPGLVITPDMIGQTLVFDRPDTFFSKGTRGMPPFVKLTICEPPGVEALYGPGGFAREAAERLAEAERRMVQDKSASAAADNDKKPPRRAGSMRKRMSRQEVMDTADSTKTSPMPPSKPVVHEIICGDPEVRRAEVARLAEFREAYHEAVDKLIAGGNPTFPFGTYARRRWGGVRVASPPPPRASHPHPERFAA